MNTLVPYLLFEKAWDIDSLLLGLEKRLPQLEVEVSKLEREDDGPVRGHYPAGHPQRHGGDPADLGSSQKQPPRVAAAEQRCV